MIIKPYENNEDVYYLRTELTDYESCKKSIDKVVYTYNQIDLLVNNAGVNDKIGLDSSIEEFTNSLSKNLVHYFTMTKLCFPYLQKIQGSIINIASKVAVTGQGNTSGYAASKGAILALTREWAVDGLKHNIRVNAIVPAEVITPQYQKIIDEGVLSGPEEITKNIPLERRFTRPKEIAEAVLYLAEKATHTTGEHLFVDGGYTHLDRII